MCIPEVKSFNRHRLSWDASNITGSGSTISFSYDAQGRRMSRTAGGVTTTYVRSGDTNGGQVLLDVAGGSISAAYVLGNELIGKGSEVNLVDGLGSTRQVTGSTGSITASSVSDAFGNTVASSGSVGEYGFAGTSGYRNDGDAGLVHIAARYYDPLVGQFISRDTYLEEKPYSYCEGDPVNFLDPSGHQKKKGPSADAVFGAGVTIELGGFTGIGVGIGMIITGAVLIAAPEPVFTKIGGAKALVAGFTALLGGLAVTKIGVNYMHKGKALQQRAENMTRD